MTTTPSRDSIRMFLVNEGLDVRYASADAFLANLGSASAGCVVTDVRMPGKSGMDLLVEIARLGLALPVIVITGHADVPLAVRAMKTGAVDLLEKPFEGDAHRRGPARSYRRPGLAIERAQRSGVAGAAGLLTARETEVLGRLVRGQPNKIIAYEMGISPRTVEVHRAM